MRRVLTDPECMYFWDRFGPQPDVLNKLDAVSEFLAGRYVIIVDGSALVNSSTDLQRKRLFAKHAIISQIRHEASTTS